ncbi:hypothetical protein CEXT_547981 [Caerostris extrusa]|uniref:Uncharacterized protein n=1 Tax=Caerostris extrusa TaxID=172846 RepID=A0AAV4NX80_CAEEX|nr:hypothetical protein CEXT_547981 [Caerostris extrusa]
MHPPSPESPGVYRISDFFKHRSMDRHRYRNDAVLQRPTEHEQPLAKQGTFAKARKRRRMRLIKTDRRQKGMAVVFLDDSRQHNTEPPSWCVREKFCPIFRRDDGRVRGFFISDRLRFRIFR